ncbi:MAG: hypothetical protein HRT87_02035 [Legionellales bacterium]|nr:hypothetical protein [Legionellales bacterium]
MPKLNNKTLTWILLSLIIICSSLFAEKPRELSYVFEKITDNSISVKLNFIGSSTGETNLILPGKWAGQDLSKNVYDIEVIGSKNTKINLNTRNYKRKIIHKPNEKIIITYKVKQNFVGKPTLTDQAHTPVIQKDYFHLIGNGFLIAPDFDPGSDDDISININLTWNLPKNWSIANSYGVQNRIQKNISSTIGELFHSLYIAGNFDLVHKKISGNDLWIAFKKDEWQNINISQLSEVSEKIIKSQRDFWNDHNLPFFLISAIPVGESSHSFGGTGLKNSFTLFLPTEIEFETGDGISWLISHEHFHTWNQPKIFQIDYATEATIYWFTEGFTDYYASLFLLRSGLSTLQEYVKVYNKVLVNYYSSSVKKYSNAEINTDFWNNREVEKLPYQRGNILAHNWNVRIKKESQNKFSFDNLIQDLIIPGPQIFSSENKLSIPKIKTAAKKYIKNGIDHDIDLNINKGELIKPDPYSLGPCCKLITKRTTRYKSGFPIEHDLKKGVISTIHKNSEAEKAGLKEGYTLFDADFDLDDINKPITVTFHDGIKKRKVQYMPYTDGDLLDIPQFVIDLNAFSKNPDACLAWFN